MSTTYYNIQSLPSKFLDFSLIIFPLNRIFRLLTCKM
jgi:hypothetical protein